MKIAIDAKPLITRSGGIGRYVREVSQHLIINPQHDFYLLGLTDDIAACQLTPCTNHTEASEQIQMLINQFSPRLSTSTRQWLAPLQRTIIGDLWYDRNLKNIRQQLIDYRFDLFWATAFFFPPSDAYRTISTIPDLGYIDRPMDVSPIMKRQLHRLLREHLKSADHILTISEFSKQRIITHFNVEPSKISIMYCGVDSSFQKISNEESLQAIRNKHKLPERFFLFVSTIEPRKNVERLLLAYDQYQQKENSDIALVLVGQQGWRIKSILKTLDHLQEKHPIFWLKSVSDQDLVGLYNLAQGFLFPSLYEGFGIPILEAMACGCPVMTSNSSACVEVAGGHAILVDPTSIDSITEGIDSITLQHNRVSDGASKHANSFSWASASHSLDRIISKMNPA